MNAFVSTITQKGQVTIPKDLRDSLRLVTGDKVEFVRNGRGEIILKPVTRKVAEVAGILRQYKPAKPITLEEMDKAVAEHIKNDMTL